MLIALDLEGTLISNAASCFPRPGLPGFLEFCRASFKRVVLYTAVSDRRVREVLRLMAAEGDIPEWFAGVEIVDWERGTPMLKDLRFIRRASLEHTLLVDDLREYVHPNQHDRWIPIQTWETPYPNTDRELERVERVLRERLGGTA